MTEIQRDLSPSALKVAIHYGLQEHILAIPSVLPEWQLETDGPFTLLYHRYAKTPLDGIYCTRLEPASADQEIARILARFRSEGRSLFWLIGSPDELPDLEERLQVHGLHPTGSVPGMAVDLEQLPTDEPLPAGVVIEPVRSDAAHAALVAIQVQTLGEAFGPRAMIKRAFGLEPEGAVEHYLGYLDGQAVAAATAVYAGGVMALYGIGSLPWARGRGVGRAITLYACIEARRRGYRVATLHATPMGLSVYERLGFTANGQMQFLVAPAP
jgi:ribosomal protein S18 acetylase RimI-like enzyme